MLAALAATIAAGTAAASGQGVSSGADTATRAVVQVSTPTLPTGRTPGARARWHELRGRSRSILQRVAHRDGLAVETSVPEVGLLSVAAGPGGVPALRRRLADDPSVESVRPDVPVQLRLSPNDFAFTHADVHAPNQDLAQWNLIREGAPRAWDLSRGTGAEVAMVDTGADGTHPDLAPRIVASQAFGTSSPLSDPIGHGTHTAGLACGSSGNGYGIASVGFNCGLFIAKILDEGPCSNVASAIVAAANRSSDVISMSLGGCDSSIVSALNYAQSRGSVIVAAGANEANPSGSCGVLGSNDCIYPEEWAQPNGTGPNPGFDRGLVVTSVQYNGTRSLFPGGGGAESTSRVSVAAYGSATNAVGGQQGVLSTWPATSVAEDDEGGRTSLNGDSRFAYLVGTSMATPQVAGVAALIRSVKPGMPNTRVVHLIKATASHCGTYGDGIGWGIIRADEAVAAALNRDIDPPSSRIRSARRVRGAGGPLVKLRLKRKDKPGSHCTKDLPVSGVKKVIVFASRNGGRYRRIGKTRAGSMFFQPKRGGRYSFYSIAVDKDGNREAPPPSPDVKRKL
jgi:serine protease